MTNQPSQPPATKLRLSWPELFALVAIMAVGAAVIVPALRPQTASPPERLCKDNLHRLGQAFLMYADENKGALPPVQIWYGENCSKKNTRILAPHGFALYPDYLSNPETLVCPVNKYHKDKMAEGMWQVSDAPDAAYDPCLFDDSSYVYTGWLVVPTLEDLNQAMRNGESAALEFSAPEWSAFAPAFRRQMRRPFLRSLDENWTYTDSQGDEHPVPRLATNLARHAGEDFRAHVPILFDRFAIVQDRASFNHFPPAINTLYMDGHTERDITYDHFPFGRGWNQTYVTIKKRSVLFENRPR